MFAGNTALPITELYGRLVNLDIAPGFAAVAPVVASDPVGLADRRAISRFAASTRQARLSSRASASPGVRFPARRWWFAPATASTTTRRSIRPSRRRWRSNRRYRRASACRTARPIRSRWRTDSSPRHHHAEHLRHRSELPRRLRAELAGLGAARSAGLADDDRDVPRHQRDARAAGVSAQHVSRRRRESLSRLSGRICLPDFQRQLHARGRPGSSCAAGLHNGFTASLQYTLLEIDRRCGAGRPRPGRLP